MIKNGVNKKPNEHFSDMMSMNDLNINIHLHQTSIPSIPGIQLHIRDNKRSSFLLALIPLP